MLFSKQQADEFFGSLRAASVEFLKNNGLPIDQGRKRYSSWKRGYPLGVTEHFTAGVTWKNTVRWLNDGGHGNSVSCQMLILDRMLPDYKAVVSKYRVLRELPVTVILMSGGVIPCWHAGWVNKLTFGIENRNVGTLLQTDGVWRWWAKNWQAEFPAKALGKVPTNLSGMWWEPYSYGQVCANILVCQMLYCLYPNMDRRWFLPHSATTGTKKDSGPLFPLNRVRDAVFDQVPISSLDWLNAFASDPDYMVGYDDDEDEDFLEEMAARQGSRLGSLEEPEFKDRVPETELQLLVEGGDWRQVLPAIRRALNKLGYDVPASDSMVLDKDTALAVWIFQKSRKDLVPDKIPGGKTQVAVAERLRQFRLA